MNTHAGYSKRTITDTNVLLAGGGDKSLADFIGGIQYVSASKKIQIKTAASGASWTDLVTLVTTDENVKQTPKTDNANRPLMMINGGTSTGTQTSTSMFSTGIYANASTKMITAAGFIKTGSDDTYVLLGGGGHKAVSDFATSTHNHDDKYVTSLTTSGNYLRWIKNGTNNDLTIPYASTSDLAYWVWVDYCRGDSNASNSGEWSRVKNTISATGRITGRAKFYTVYKDGGPTNYGEVLEICSRNSNYWQPQLWFGSGKGGHLYYRNKNNNDDTWGDWATILDSNNYTSYINGQFWANVNISSSSSVITQPTFGSVIIGNVTTTNPSLVNVLTIRNDSYSSQVANNNTDWDDSISAYGISFDRYWNGYNDSNAAGIYAFGGGGWSTGLVFRTKSGTKGGQHNITSLILRGNGKVVAPQGFIGNLTGNADTATKLGTVDVGSTTKGIYLDNGTPKEMSYSLSSNVNASNATNRMAWYSATTTLTYASTIYASNTQLTVGGTSAPANSGIFQAIGTSTMQHIYPQSNGAYDLGKTDSRWRTGYYTTSILVGATGYTAATSAVAGTLISAGSIEMSGSTPYIDFHNGLSTADFTTRIIEDSQGRIHIQRGTATTVALTYNSREVTPLLYVQGVLYSNSNIESASAYILNRTSKNGGYYLLNNNATYARLYVATVGTASDGSTQGALGEVYLTLGNATARGAAASTDGAENARGRLIVYASDTTATTIMHGSWSGSNLTVVSGTSSVAGETVESMVIVGNANKKSAAKASSTGRLRLYGEEDFYHDIYPNSPTAARTHYLPNASGWIATGGNGVDTGVGTNAQPVYLNTSGKLVECTAVEATKIKVTQNISANAAYPLIWASPADATTQQSTLYKSYDKITFNPKTFQLIVAGNATVGTLVSNGYAYLRLAVSTAADTGIGTADNRIYAKIGTDSETYGIRFYSTHNPSTTITSYITYFYGGIGSLEYTGVAAGTQGYQILTLGSTTKISSANSKAGVLRLYTAQPEGSTATVRYGQIWPLNLTANRTYYLPNASGTIALVTDITNRYWANVKVSDTSSNETTPRFLRIGLGTAVNSSYSLAASGNCLAAHYYESSDIRLKHDISSISQSIRKFRFNEDNKLYYGFIAQELETLHPELVDNSGEYKTVNYNSAICYYIAELENKVQKLEDEINKLKNK